MSISTGPGRPCVAMWNASWIVPDRRSVSFTSQFILVQGRVMPTVSASWNASEPIMKVGTWPVRTTIGIESISASVRPVTAFVAPGPEVTRTTPGLPVARA
jgi:hypothetical protein